ncbi:SpaA isopeptide-forming pilin-related protein [Varibaculum vaginae]|uniref:SpaA isopeptide-forming pilin-related protein n=1 Tax=Varibaculum vaginae TaxID=2364797 RepID=UPI000F08DB28|nr:SpaA isopeptide-forming pilin-related protein [Varibaculum vaginae]
MASKVLSRRLVAALSVLGLLLSTLLVVVPLTASAKSEPVKASSVSAASKSGIAKAVRSGQPVPGQLSLQDLSAGAPQALRSPAPLGQGAPLSDPRFTYNGTEITGLTAKGNKELETKHELTIPDGTTKIAAGVFSEKGLTKVTLPDSVTEVAERAFYDNQIEKLSAPGLITIGAGAFQKNQLKVFESSTVGEIGEGAFTDNQLETLRITDERPDDTGNPPKRLTKISDNAFRDNQLKTVELPPYVTEIGASAFANNRLQEITLPPSLQKVGQEAFSGNQIEKVKIPATITTFGKEVFSNNQRWVVLENADGQTSLPTAVKSAKYKSGFGQVAAEDAVSITINYVDADTNKPLRSPQILQSEFTEPDGVYFADEPNKIKAPVFAGYEATESSKEITPVKGEKNELTFTYKKTDFSPKISGEIVKHIDHGGDGSTAALLAGVTARDADGNDITASLTVSPETVDTRVEGTVQVYYTAKDSQGRTKTVKGNIAVGPNWPEQIICAGWQVKDFAYRGGTITGFSATGNDKNRKGKTKDPWCWPTFGDQGQPIKSIGMDAFSGRYKSPKLTRLPDSWGTITTIEWGAFEENEITSLPDSWGKVTHIVRSAFENNQIEALPDSWGDVTELGYCSFSDNKIAKLPDSWGKITKLPASVFYKNNLTALPKSWESITSIGGSAFAYNHHIKALPDSWGNVTGMGTEAFQMNELTTLPKSWGKVDTLGEGAFSNNKLTELPNSWGKITVLRKKVFESNKLVSLPAWGKVTSVGESAFRNNQITTLPDSWGKITSLPAQVFKSNQIASLPAWGSITSIGESAFEKNKLVKLPNSWENVSRIDTSSFASNLLTTLPDSWGKITTIPERAFYDNQLAVLPAWGTVTTIGKNSFVRNNLTVLPPSWDEVTTIESCAFAGKMIYQDSASLDYRCYPYDANTGTNINQIQSLPSSWGKVKTVGAQAFMGNALAALPNSWGEISNIGEESFKDNKITALTAPWENFTAIPRGAFLNNEIVSLPSSWGKIAEIGMYSFLDNRLKALPSSWGEVKEIQYGAFANNELTALPDSWGKIALLGTRPRGASISEGNPHAHVFGYSTSNPKTRYIDSQKNKNNITALPESLGDLWAIGPDTFSWEMPRGMVFTVPDAPLINEGRQYDHLEQAVKMFSGLSWGLDGAGPNTTYGGLRGPIYLRPESGKNPKNIPGYVTGYGNDIIILTSTKVQIDYLGPNDAAVAPSETRSISTKDSGGANKYTLVPPVVKGYSIPEPEIIDLDGTDKHVVFRYKPTPAEFAGTYAILNLTGKLYKLPNVPDSRVLEDEIGQKLQTNLTYGGKGQNSVVKNGVIRVAYDPNRVYDPEVKITENSGFKEAKVVAPGILEVKLEPGYGGNRADTIPILWRLKERVTPAGKEFPITATLLDTDSQGNRYVLQPHADSYPGPVILKGHYKLPTFYKDTANCDREGICRDYDDDAQGHVKETGNNAVTFTFTVDKLKRNVRGYTITDQLPLYMKVNGTQVRAEFVESENPGWKLGEDEITLTYTNTTKHLTTETPGLGILKLHFPGAKKQRLITNTANFKLIPEDKGAIEPEITGSASTVFSFYKPMETRPPEGIALSKTPDGPHFPARFGYNAVIFDTKQDRTSEINWNVLTNNLTDTPGTLNLRDFDLDTRLQYTAITPDPVFVGGKLEIISPTGEPGKFQVLYSVAITQPGRIELPAELTEQYDNVQLRWSSVKATQPGQTTITKIHTKLRDPDAGMMDTSTGLCNEDGKCESDLRNKIQGGERIEEAHIMIKPEGKTLQARKESSFRGINLPGSSGTYDVGARLEVDYGDPLSGFELVDVLPQGLEVTQVTLTQKFSELPGAHYEILSNFKNTGRMAVRFLADQVNDPYDVYSVGRLETSITNQAPPGAMTNEAFVQARGNVEYPEDKSDKDKDKWITTVNNPVAGDGKWSRAENKTYVGTGSSVYVTKRIREGKPGAPWVNQINTVGNANFDYQLRLGYGDEVVTDPVIYDLLPVTGTPARVGSTLVNRYNPQGQIKFEMANGEPVVGWQTFFTCATGIARDELATATWYASPSCGNVTGLKFVNNTPQKPRTEVRITVPMIAGPEGVDARSQSELGKQAINDIWSVSRDNEKLDSNKVINTLVPPAVDIELQKFGCKGIAFSECEVKKKKLAGAKFGLFNKEGVLKATVISDSEGWVRFKNTQASPGWTVRELEAPLGYSPSSKAFILAAANFSATNYDGVNGKYRIILPDVTNYGSWQPIEPVKGSVTFKKVDKDLQPLTGIEFTITPQPVEEIDKNGNGTGIFVTPNSAPITVRSNDFGEVKFYNIPAGKWRLTENPGDRHLQPIDPIDFTISRCVTSCTNLNGLNLAFGSGDLGLVINDKGRVSLSKLGVRGMADKKKTFGDWQRGDGVIKGGATFELYRGTTDNATNRVKTVTTARDGQMNVILDGLDLDQVYTLKETVAPAGYIKSDALMQFQINAAGKLMDASGKKPLLEQGELLVPNEQEKQKSSLVITKVDPKAAATARNLKGAVFGLFKQAGDGSWPTEPITKVTTGDTGQAEFTELEGGIYRVKELKAPVGYYVDSRAQYDFVVDDYKAQQFTWTANNDRSRLQVFKFEPLVTGVSEDAADKVVSGTPNAIKMAAQTPGTFDVVIPLAGAEFSLLEADGKTQVPGAGVLVTDKDGYVEVPAAVKLDPDKVYKLKETKAPAGYILKSNLISVKVSDYSSLSGFTGLITMEVPNTKNTGRVTVSKLAQETGKPLAGAEFTLKDVTANTEKTLTTNEVGLATFTGLPFGHEYELRESKAPDGYKLSADVEKFTLTSDKEPVKTFTRYNRLNKVDITLNKVDDNGSAMAGVVFELYKEGASAPEQSLTTGKDGTAKFTVEPEQIYILKEISTKQGYALLPQPVKFRVTGDGKVTVISGKGEVNTVSGGGKTLTVTNYPEGEIPLSGYAGALEVLLLGCLVLGIAMLFTLFERKRK